MTKRIVALDKKVNESIGPFKKHTGYKIAVIIITRFLSRVSILLLTRDIDIVILSVCPSIRLSVTRWYCMKTA